MSEKRPASIKRRHDLDALRAIAMLLGIVLHGAMSFIPGIGPYWAVHDPGASEWFGLLLASIHGFRMPLFFLISGFFTAMLWRKRGLQALVFHRFKRIFLPMVLALFTIIPLIWIVSAYVSSAERSQASDSDTDDATETSTADGQKLIEAAVAGDTETVSSLLENGTDVDSTNEEGSTALHVACFFGHAETARVLLQAGANTDVRDIRGSRPEDVLHVSWDITQLIANSIQYDANEEDVINGRREIAEELDVPFNMQVSGAAGNPLSMIIGLLMTFPLFGHLWFLWFLCWLVCGFVIAVRISDWLKIPAVPKWLTTSLWRYVWLIPLTAIPQFFMGRDGTTFGPDTSIGLIPIPTVLAYYTIFFGYGALYFDANDDQGTIGKFWWLTLALAVFVWFPIGIAGMESQDLPTRSLTVFCQVLYAWMMSFGLMGLFRNLLSAENRTLRYISDSSYWLYLAHIPLIILMQYIVVDWPVPALIKFVFVCSATSLLLLVSYQLCVRNTLLGVLLNGRRYGRQGGVVQSQLSTGTLHSRGPIASTLRY